MTYFQGLWLLVFGGVTWIESDIAVAFCYRQDIIQNHKCQYDKKRFLTIRISFRIESFGFNAKGEQESSGLELWINDD